MKKVGAKKADNASPQTTVFFCAHTPAGTSANTTEYECAEYTCALISNKKDTSFAVSFSLISLFIFIFLIAIPIFGVTFVLNPLLVLGDMFVFLHMILYMIKSNELYRN